MRVKIGKYCSYFGPYQLAEALCFWAKRTPDRHGFDSTPDWVHKFGDFLAHGFAPDESDTPLRHRINAERPETWLYKTLKWIDAKKNRRVKIHVDKWDTWNLDATLAMIILPMLKQLKETKHGSGMIDLEDVPEELRYTETEDYDSQKTFDFYREEGVVKKDCDVHTRYEWALDEMIWAFEQLQPDCDWEDQYRSGEHDVYWEVSDVDENGKPRLYQMKRGPADTYKADYEAIAKHEARINNGLRLFGKYFCTLWD